MLVSRKLLLDKFELRRALPRNFRIGDEAYFYSELVRSCNGVPLIEAENALLDVDKGVVINGWKVSAESLAAPSLQSGYGLAYVLRTRMKGSKELKGGPYLLIHTSYCSGYGHWMSDAIPRLYITRGKLQDCKVILPSAYRHAFYLDSLAPFGIRDTSRIEYVDSPRVRVDHLAYSSHVGPSFCNVKDEVLQDIRRLYFEYFNLGNAPPTRRIYVSREKVARRFVRNEVEVVNCLTKQGFEVVHFQELTFIEQLKLASESEVMIGLTGSGLNNMMFMQPGSKVLEFKMHNDYHNLHYFGFASGLQLPYYYLICDTVGKVRFEADFMVDCNALETCVCEMLS